MDGNGYGGACGTVNIAQQYINECAYNGAFEHFKWLYGDEIVRPARGVVASGQILKYDQNEFLGPKSSMNSNGLIYVPQACKDKTTKCRFHVAFHGCMSNE